MNAVRRDPDEGVSAGLFKGIAVVIDDGIGKVYDGVPDGIDEVIQAIKSAGGHAVILDALPPDDDELDGFSNAAFFIMDWNLHGSALQGDGALDPALLGLQMGGLAPAYERMNVDFLKKLRSKRHAPVFILTNESVTHVAGVLRENGVMGDDSGAHIMIKSKREVGADLYRVLDQWLQETPSAWVLKQWEQHQTQAINTLFNEFHDRNKYWPVIFWNAYKADDVSPEPELGELITRLVGARMKPLTVNLDAFAEQADQHFGANAEGYRDSLHAVLQSERLLPNSVLNPDEFSAGDLFLDPNGGHPRLLINVRPACDCIQRQGITDEKMHLLRGLELSSEKFAELADHENGNLREKDVETIIFSLYEGKTISFGFRSLYQKNFSQLKGNRIGRVLPPFLTRITQRYAAYSHRPGLPRIPSALMPSQAIVLVDAPANTVGPQDEVPANQGPSG